ncbi:histone-lysine N-methyltransferase SETMAR [Trichonephila clavipes]|nr:histone-lysine N-methyltransferase SETMAR [Trichonephila clavipes]
MAEIGQQKRCVPSRQCQATHVCSDSPDTLGAWLESLMHPPYSPDLSPNDCHLFLALLNFQRNKKLGSREDCENRLLEFFANKGQDLYERGNMKLLLNWQQIIQQNGTYLNQIGQSHTC